MRIERPIGTITIHDNGIISTRYHNGTVVREEEALEELALYDHVFAQYGQILVLNDLRGRISADRGARHAYGTFRHPDLHTAMIFDSKIVEVALNFIERLYDRKSQRDIRAFPDFDTAYAWLEGFTNPQSTMPPEPFEMPPHFKVK